MSDKPVDPALEIQMDNLVAQGVYANLAVINHTDSELTLDFVYVQPQEMRGTLRSRVIVSPRHAKRLLQALQGNIDRYEQNFGPIDSNLPESDTEMGPYH